jgi:hypothetical protein
VGGGSLRRRRAHITPPGPVPFASSSLVCASRMVIAAPPISSPRNFPSRAMTRTQSFVETAFGLELPGMPPASCIADTTFACRIAATDAKPFRSRHRFNVPAVIPGASAIAHPLAIASNPGFGRTFCCILAGLLCREVTLPLESVPVAVAVRNPLGRAQSSPSQ